MIYIRVRYLLILLFMAIGIVLHYQLGFRSAVYCYLASLLLFVTYYLFGTVGPAFHQLRRGKIVEAEKLINMTRRPDFLLPRHRAYYHFTKGMIALQKEEPAQNFGSAELHLKSALDSGLRSDTDKALVSLNLAHIYFMQNRRDDCLIYLGKAKTFESNDLLIQEKIKELERALAAPHN